MMEVIEFSKLPRGQRNHNPLNIKYSKRNNWLGKVLDSDKKDPKFEEFTTNTYGLRAALKLIRLYCIRDNGSTVRAIVRRWAPPSDSNPTDSYTAYVERRMRELLVGEWKYALEFDPNRRISADNMDVMHALIVAMSEFESQYTPPDYEFREAWRLVKQDHRTKM